MDQLLIVEPGDILKKYYFEKLCECEIEVFVAGRRYPTFLDELVPRSHFIETDPYNPHKLISDVTSFMYVSRIKFAGVGTFFEHAVPSTSFLGSALGLPHLPASAAFFNSQNKLLMRQRCANAGVPGPRYELIADLTPESLVHALEQVGTPAVLKPLFGNQSSGVIKIDSFDQIALAIDWARSSWSYKQEDAFCNFSGSFLVEEYVPGGIITGDGLIQKGRVLCVFSVEIPLGREPYFVQTGNIIPARISYEQSKECETLIGKICHTLGLDNCGFHAEFRLDPQRGLNLIEIAARLPGGHIVKGYEQAYGVNLVAAQAAVWLGRTVQSKLLVPNMQRCVIHKGIYPTSSGIFSSLANINELNKKEGVLEVIQIVKDGDYVIGNANNRKPLFFYAVQAGCVDESCSLAQSLEAEIRYEIAPTQP